MTLTSYNDLRDIFLQAHQANEATSSDKSPIAHWTLYVTEMGTPERRIMQNTKVDNMEESLEFLVSTMRKLNHPDGVKFRVMQYAPGKSNNPAQNYFVQVYERGGNNMPATQVAGIGSLPGMYGGNIEAYISERIELAMLKKENEDLRAAINAPSATWERILDRVAENPAITGLITNLAIGWVGKTNPALAQTLAQSAMNGHPNTDTDETGDPQTIFAQNIQAASDTLGIDPVTLAQKLNKLVQQNPEMAKQLL